MKKIYSLTAVSILALFISIETYSQQDAPAAIEQNEHYFEIDGKKITLTDYITILLERNPDLKNSAYTLAMSDSDYQKFQKKYAFMLNASTSYGQSKYAPMMQSRSGESSSQFTAGAGIVKMFSTGTTIAAGVTHEYDKVNNISGSGGTTSSYSYYQPVAYASIQQELFRAAFGRVDKGINEVLKNASEIQNESTRTLMSGIVIGAVIDFWSVILSKGDFDTADMKYNETVRVRNIVRENVNLGLAERQDLNMYNAMVAGAEVSRAMAEQIYRDALRKLLRSLGYEADVKIGGVGLIASEIKPVPEESLKLAYDRRADYRIAKLAYKNAELDLMVQGYTGFPSLVASLDVNSMTQRDALGDAYGDTASAKYPSWNAKLTLSHPLNDPEVAVNRRDAKYRYGQAKVLLGRTEREIKDEITARLENIATSYTAMKLSDRAAGESENYYALVLANLRRGRFNAVVTKNALDLRADSRQRALAARIQYNIALLQLDLATNSLFVKYGIDISKIDITK